MGDVQFYPDRLAVLFGSENGPVGKDLLRRVIQGETGSKRLCPVDTGRLRASITHGLGSDSKGLFGRWGSDVEYAPYVEFSAQAYLRPVLAEVLNDDGA